MSPYKFTPWAVASPDAPQKPLVQKRARSGGATWVQVQRHEPGSRAKKPRTSHSQPPACTHKEHDILTTAEAAAFAAQFWDQKTHPTKASQQEFLATCIDVDVDKNVKYKDYQKYTITRGHRTKYFNGAVPCLCAPSNVLCCAEKCDHLPPPPPNPYISETAFSRRFQKVYTYPLGAFSHSAHTAPIITVIIQVTTLKTTHLRNHAQSIQNSKIQTSDACHGSQGRKFCPL